MVSYYLCESGANTKFHNPRTIGRSTFPKLVILNQHFPGIKLLLGKQELCKNQDDMIILKQIDQNKQRNKAVYSLNMCTTT